MKWLLIGLFLIPPLLMVGMDANEEETLDTVDQLEINKYLGEWYAIASIERFFNKYCAWGNKAEYSLRDDGRIGVKNSCYRENGEKSEVTAAAWVPDENEPGKLKVSFVPFFDYKLFPADYWVLELGENYDYAVVGHPSRNFGWILSRDPHMETERLEAIKQRLEAVGYDFSDFKLNPQNQPGRE